MSVTGMGGSQGLQTLEGALGRLTLANTLYGLRIIEYPRGRPRRFLSILYLLFITAYCYLMFRWIPEKHPDMEDTGSEFTEIFFDLTILLDVGIIILYSFLGMFRSKMYNGCVRRLTKVDRTLESLGSSINYKRMRKRVTYILFGWVVFVICTFAAGLRWLWLKNSFWTALSFALAYTRSLDVSGMVDLTFVILVISVGERLEHINDLLRAECGGVKDVTINRNNDVTIDELSHQNAVREPYTISESSDDSVLRKKRLVRTVRLLHFELRQSSKYISTVFGVQMALELATSLLLITGLLFVLYRAILQCRNQLNLLVTEIVMTHYYIAIYVGKIAIVNLACEKVARKADKTVDLSFEVAFSMDDPETKEEIQQFGMEAKKAKFEFTAYGAFPLDCRIVRSVFGTVITYLLILVQMG